MDYQEIDWDYEKYMTYRKVLTLSKKILSASEIRQAYINDRLRALAEWERSLNRDPFVVCGRTRSEMTEEEQKKEIAEARKIEQWTPVRLAQVMLKQIQNKEIIKDDPREELKQYISVKPFRST